MCWATLLLIMNNVIVLFSDAFLNTSDMDAPISDQLCVQSRLLTGLLPGLPEPMCTQDYPVHSLNC